MATESMVFQQEYEETRGTDRKNYDYTSVQTQYDPGYIHEEAGFQHTKRNENNSKDGAKYDYKPTALRLWFLLLAAAFLLGCIAAAEYALRTEPSASQVYQNTTFSRRGGPAVPAKGWLGAAWGNNLAPDGMPRARGMARMDRVDLRVVERVPGSTNYMPSGLTTVRVTRAPVTSRQSQTKEISTSVTVTTERVVSVTVTLPAATSNVGEPGTTTDTWPLETSPLHTSHTPARVTTQTTSVDSTITIPATTTQILDTTTDESGNLITTSRDVTLSAQPITTKVLSTLVDTLEPGSFQTTLVDETTTVPAVTTRIPETTTDESGNLIATSRDVTLSAQTITTKVLSTFVDTLEPGSFQTTLVDETITTPAVTTHVLETTTDVSGRLITTSRETTLSAVTITTKVLSTVVDMLSFKTTLVDETITIPAVTTRIPETTTDVSGRLITTSRETTLSAVTITTKVVSTLPTTPTVAAALLGPDGTQRRLGVASTPGTAEGGGHPTAAALVEVVASTLAYATVLPTTIPTVLPGAPGGGGDGPAGSGDVELEVLGLTTAQYFAGAFLPTVLAVVATSLLEVIGTNAKLMQPFQALASASSSSSSSGGGGRGAVAEASVFLRFDAYMGLLAIPQAVRLGQPLIVATQLMVLGSAFLAPLAAEAVAISTPAGCTAMCWGRIAVQRSAARALEGLLGAMAVLVVAVLALTGLKRWWRTGVNHNPWSIAGMASLCLNREVRALISRIPRGEGRAVTEKEIAKVLEGRRYKLDEFVEPTRHGVSYGLVVMEEDGRAGQQRSLLETDNLEGHNEGEANRQQAERSGAGSPGFSSWLAPLSWWFRTLLIFCVASVMAIVGYYQNSTGSSGFERFMDSGGFGVRFFSTLLGVLLGGLMGALFECVAVLTPFLRLSQRALPAERSILLSPPTNAFSGLLSAYRQRSPFLGILSFTTILAKIVLPVTLDHVAFSYNTTWLTEQICAWLSIGIMALMIAVVAGSFLIRWPYLPVDPSTIAGAMFYLCDSHMLETFEDLAYKNKRQRDTQVRAMGVLYAYGQATSVGKKKNLNIDVYDSKIE